MMCSNILLSGCGDMESKRELIDKYFNTYWCEEDFFEAYCNARGVDRWELDEDEERKMAEIVRKKITVPWLERLREVIVKEINEILVYAMREN